MDYDSFQTWRPGSRSPDDWDPLDDYEPERMQDPDEDPELDPNDESLFDTCPPEVEEEEDEYSWLDLRAELDRLDALDRAEKDREDRDWRHAA